MDQHSGGITLLTSQLAMGNSGEGHYGITVISGQRESAQTCHYVANQLRKMSGTLFIAKMKVVEFRGAFCSHQPIGDQGGSTAGQYCGHALLARGF